MRSRVLCLLFCAGCFDYGALSSEYDVAERDGASIDLGHAIDAGQDDTLSSVADLAGDDLSGVDLAQATGADQSTPCIDGTHQICAPSDCPTHGTEMCANNQWGPCICA